MAQFVDDRKSATIERRAKLFRGFADPSLSDVDALLDVVAEGVEACDNYRGA